jgi:hypothetical protein
VKADLALRVIVLSAIASSFACARQATPIVRPPDHRPIVAPKVAAPGAGWSYEVVASPHGETLAIDAAFPPGTAADLTVGDDAESFVKDLVVVDGATRTPIAPSRGQWKAPSCAAGCRITYTFALAEAARSSGDRSVAAMHGEAIESPPSSWLLRPLEAPPGLPFRFHVTSAPGDAFASGVFPVAGSADTYEGHTGNGYDLPYAAFGRIRRIPLAGGHVEVAILPGTFAHEDTIIAWIDRAEKAVEGFYGHFPIPRVLLLVEPVHGSRVGFGTTMGNAGAAIEVPVGEDVSPEALRQDWMLVHEMIHTALPDVTRRHHWLEEGIATYAEPLARVHAGLIKSDQMWKEWVLGMPKGEPEPGDQGLDVTHTWGRTYWGGALFCLEADVTIRERTGGKHSLADALRAIVAQDGNIAVSWPVEKVLDVGDAATGVPVLRETYARMATQPGAVDLEALWKKLGVHLERGVVTYDDAAPLASIRKAMSERP